MFINMIAVYKRGGGGPFLLVSNVLDTKGEGGDFLEILAY